MMQSVELNTGKNSVKISKDGKYSFELVSCYKFNTNLVDTNTFTIPVKNGLELTAVEAKIYVDVISSEKKPKNFQFLIQ